MHTCTCNILFEIISFNFLCNEYKYSQLHNGSSAFCYSFKLFFGFSLKGKREQYKWNRIYCILILALATIIAVSIAITVVVVRDNEGNDDKTDWETNNMQLHNALPTTTIEPDVISTTRGME